MLDLEARDMLSRTGLQLVTQKASSTSGFSIALDGDQRPATLTWYSTTDALLGPDEKANRALRRVGEKRGWDTSSFKALTNGKLPGHVLLGTAVASRKSPAFTATLAFELEQLIEQVTPKGLAA